MMVLRLSHLLVADIKSGEYAGEKKAPDGPTDAQKWKIQKLCKSVGRDADALIPTLRTVSEASGIIDQLLAEVRSRGFARGDQTADKEGNVKEADR